MSPGTPPTPCSATWPRPSTTAGGSATARTCRNVRQLAAGRLVPNPPVIREGNGRHAHRDQSRAQRPGRFGSVPGGAGRAVGRSARGPRDADPEPAAVLEGRRRAGPAGRAPGRSRWRTGVRHPRAGHRARRVRLRRGAGPVRSVGDRQRADLRARPRGQAAERPGLRRRDRRLRHRLRADRHPAGRRPGHPRRGAGGSRGRAGVGAGAAGGDRQRRRVGGARRRPAGDRTRAERRPAAAGGPCARQRRRGRRRPRAEQPEPRPGACADVDAAVRRGDRRRALGHRHRRRRTPRSASSSAGRSASSRPSSTSAPR